MSARLGMRVARMLRAPAVPRPPAADSASANIPPRPASSGKHISTASPPDPSKPLLRAVKFTNPSDPLPPRTKPRWQNPAGVEAAVMPPQFPWLTRLAQGGHVIVVSALIIVTGISVYAVGESWSTVRSRRIAWEKANPEHHAKLVAEAAAKKKAEADKAATKYAPQGEVKPAAQ